MPTPFLKVGTTGIGTKFDNITAEGVSWYYRDGQARMDGLVMPDTMIHM
jgi:hypothetical protein